MANSEVCCALCEEELEAGSYPQLTTLGEWICEKCMRASTGIEARRD